MIVALDKIDLINLVKSINPKYMNALVEEYGDFFEVNEYTYDKKWFWNFKLKDLSEKELYAVYNYCKNSWNKN